ncbi:DUF1524 domain-containing protein [Micrococcales bacterium 31B]|nr:DUF1524 domain-containing protein [Micrococcales bacterium 31B]
MIAQCGDSSTAAAPAEPASSTAGATPDGAASSAPTASAAPSADPTTSATPSADPTTPAPARETPSAEVTSGPAATLTPAPTPNSDAASAGGAGGGGGASGSDSRAGTALAQLAPLAVKGRAARTGYDRALFAIWTDTDRNGCDARNDTLRRDLTEFTLKAGTRGCLVLTGTLNDPYTGATIPFVRGSETSTAVQIDHVVSLSNAWQMGAQQWDAGTRAQFGSDPLNLLAVDGPSNQQKGDGDAATWLPRNTAFRCEYVSRQIAVKSKYGLAVTAAEKDAMVRILSACDGGRVVEDAGTAPLGGREAEAGAPLAAAPPATQAPVAPQPTSAAPVSSEPAYAPPPAAAVVEQAPSSVYYKNCDAVRKAGAAPIRKGQPGYSTKLDRDGDGMGCE